MEHGLFLTTKSDVIVSASPFFSLMSLLKTELSHHFEGLLFTASQGLGVSSWCTPLFSCPWGQGVLAGRPASFSCSKDAGLIVLRAHTVRLRGSVSRKGWNGGFLR